MSFYSLNLCDQETSSSHTSAEALYYSRVTRWWTPKDGWKSETLVDNCTRLEWPLGPRGVCEQTRTLVLQAGGLVLLHRHHGCILNHTGIYMRALLNHEHVQGSSRPSDLTPAQSRRSPGPCRAQSARLLRWTVALGLHQLFSCSRRWIINHT